MIEPAYIRAREILLQYFDIVAIAELGSGTFGKTGTNTVTLFLRRKPTSPDTAEHYRGRVAEWFKADENQPVYRDEHLIDAYAAHIGVPAADYKTLLQGQAGGAWMNHDHFEEYKNKFNDSSEVEKLSKQRAFKALSAEAKEAELNKRFLINVQNLERDKIYHFVMASDQKHPVLVIRAPADSKAQKAFLGYDWSASKGGEGIKLVKDAAGQHLTPLYDESDRRNPGKFNYLIAEAFKTGSATPAGLLSDLANLCPLVDLLDFKRSVFEKQLILSAAATLRASMPARSGSDWVPLHSTLTRIADVIDPASESGVVNYVGLERIVGGTGKIWDAESVSFDTLKSTKNLFKAGDILYGKLRPNLNKVCMAEFDGICSTELLVLRAVTPEAARFYLDYLLSKSFNEEVLRTVAGQQLPRTSWKSMGALLVPRFTQERLGQALNELDEVRSATLAAGRTLDLAQAEIIRAVADVYIKVGSNATIESLSLDVQYGLNEAMNESGIGYKIFRMNEIAQQRMVDGGQMKCADLSAEEFAKYKLNRGDVLFNRTNGSVDQVGKVGMFDLDGDYCFASYLVRVVPDPDKIIPQFLCLMMSSENFKAEARAQAVKSAGQININATKMRNIKVPVPSFVEQQQLVDKVQKLETKIADAQAVITAAPARKQAILQRYL